MRRIMLAICLTGLAVFAVKTTAQEKLPLRLVATTPMPGFTGDFDHFGLDLKGNRLFLAAEDQKTVEVFDLRTGKRIHSIEGFGHPLTMAYLSESDRLIVTNGDTDDLTLVDCKEYKIINTLKLGKGVDHSRLQPREQIFLCGERRRDQMPKTHALAIIDTRSFKIVGEVPGLSGDSNEGMVIDHAGKKTVRESSGSDEVGVIDLETRQINSKVATAGRACRPCDSLG